MEEFDNWVESTGALEKNTSWYFECQSIIEDALTAQRAEFAKELKGMVDYGEFFSDGWWCKQRDDLIKKYE